MHLVNTEVKLEVGLNSEGSHEVKYEVYCKVRFEVKSEVGLNFEGYHEVKYEINHNVKSEVGSILWEIMK